jgi:uncharacterized membrane protein YraQ (UPF0718 family)
VQRLKVDVLAKRNFTRHGVRGILITTAIGAFSPFCSFTVIPLIRRFLVAGVPLSAVMAFWIASPSMDPEIYALTAAQLGIPVATARLVGALVLSLGAGLLTLFLERRGAFSAPLREEVTPTSEKASCSGAQADAPACSAAETAAPVAVGAASAGQGGGTRTVEDPAQAPGACAAPSAKPAEADDDDGTPWRVLAKQGLKEIRLVPLLKEIVSDSRILGKWLLLAIVAEAVIVKYVPASTVQSILGTEGILSVVVAGLISVPLYLNGVGAIPVIGGLMDQGMAAAAGVTFLLGGAVTTIPAMVAVRSVVNNRVFGLYLGVSFLGAIALGIALLPIL